MVGWHHRVYGHEFEQVPGVGDEQGNLARCSPCPLLLLPSIFSSIRVFSNESAICIRWPKYCSFSISPSSQYSEYSVSISFRIGRVVLLSVRGILKGHLSSTTIRKHHSTFLMIQLTHLYTTTGKTIVLTLQTFVSKVMSLLFNMLSRFVMGFPGAQR